MRTLTKCDCTPAAGKLYIDESTERAVLVGIVTDGVLCNDVSTLRQPRVQTRVATWLQFILDKVRE